MNLLLIAALYGGGYWLNLQDWSTDGVAAANSADASLELRRACILDLRWSADGNAFLSRSAGPSRSGSSLLLHRFTDETADPRVSARPDSSTSMGNGPVVTEAISTGDRHVWNAALFPDASAVIVVDESQTISRIDILSGARTELIDVSRLNRVPALSIPADGSCLAVAFDGDVWLLDPVSGREVLRLSGRSASVTDIGFSDDGRSIAAGYGDGMVRVWNRASGEWAHDLARHGAPVSRVRFIERGRLLASIGMQGDDTLRLSDPQSGELVWQVSADQMGLFGLAISADGNMAATGGHDGEIVLWSLNERARLRKISGHDGTVQSLQFSQDGKTLTSASSDGTIRIWDVDSGNLLCSIDVGEIASPTRGSF